jgi:hypothetical protein
MMLSYGKGRFGTIRLGPIVPNLPEDSAKFRKFAFL